MYLYTLCIHAPTLYSYTKKIKQVFVPAATNRGPACASDDFPWKKPDKPRPHLSSSTSTKTQFKSNILKHFCHWHPHHPQPHLLNLEIDDAAISCLFVALERLCLVPLHYLLNGLWPLWHNYYTLTLQHLATGINRTFRVPTWEMQTLQDAFVNCLSSQDRKWISQMHRSPSLEPSALLSPWNANIRTVHIRTTDVKQSSSFSWNQCAENKRFNLSECCPYTVSGKHGNKWTQWEEKQNCANSAVLWSSPVPTCDV